VSAALTLDLVEALLETPLPVMRGCWPQAVALLARQSLEEAIDELWAGTLPAMAGTSARAQLLCVAEYPGDDEIADGAAHAWAGSAGRAITAPTSSHPPAPNSTARSGPSVG
jgi:hypothetical protein